MRYIDPDGHFFWFFAFTAAVVGAVVWGKTSEQGERFWTKYGDFISPLGRAIVTNDWKNFGMQTLNIAGIAGGVASGNYALATASTLSYLSRATSHIGDNASQEIARVLNYAALAIMTVQTISDFGTAVQNWSDMSKLDSQTGVKIHRSSGDAYRIKATK